MNQPEQTYIALNGELNLRAADGSMQLDKDKAAARAYFLEHVNQRTTFFHNLDERLEYLVEKNYYEAGFLAKYSHDFIVELNDWIYAQKFRFPTFVGAYKFFRQYALRTNDGENYLERFEDRVLANALYLADGDEDLARATAEEIISGRLQPATPTFLNAGRKQRGELVSCFLVEVSDDMNSIGRAVNTALQLSKRGGGVAFNLTDLRATMDPIKGVAGQAAGVIPVMKILQDCFKYANQLGQRDGSGAVYLNIFHKDIEVFLDSRRENADDAIRINRLSLGAVVPDIFFELVKNDEPMYLFSPYEVAKKYGVPFSAVNMSEVYRELVDDPEINKKKIRARTLLANIAETLVESGYPYILFEDNVNRQNPIDGKIKMSNLCSEILQVQTPSQIADDQTYTVLGKDISCNLGSINIAKVMDGDIARTVETGIRVLTHVSDTSDISSAPSIDNGNRKSHAVGLGAMNLHGFLASKGVEYGSPEALDFVNVYFATVAFHAIRTSNLIAKERGETFEGFEKSKYATGEFFEKYTTTGHQPTFESVAGWFEGQTLPTREDWAALAASVAEHGMYNQNLQAVAPTGSISYVNNSTASILPITAKVEARKEGMMGQVYWPAPHMTNENAHLYKDGYEVGPKAIIDTYAAAQPHVDQGMSLTLFFSQDSTTRDINKAQIYAWRKGIKTLYYARVKMNVMEGLEDDCVSCAV